MLGDAERVRPDHGSVVQVTIRRMAGLAAVFVLLLAVGLLPKCEGSGPHPYTGPAEVMTSAARTAALQCSKAYGDCQVTEYIHVRRDGTEWIETCYEAKPVTEGHGGVFVAVDYCYRP